MCVFYKVMEVYFLSLEAFISTKKKVKYIFIKVVNLRIIVS